MFVLLLYCSHFLVTLYIDAVPVDESTGAVRTFGKLSFVDLAGSERAKESGTDTHRHSQTLTDNHRSVDKL